ETLAIELTAGPPERGIVGDLLGHLGVRQRETERTGALIEHDLGDELPDDKTVEPNRSRLFRRDRPAELAGILLQSFVVEIAELLDRDLGAADLRNRGAAEAAENIADPPDREADDQEADHPGHDRFAEPVGRGFPQTSKHALSVIERAQARPFLACVPAAA